MTQDWEVAKKRILKIAKERKYCGLTRDTLDGFVEMSKDKDAAVRELSLILAEETEERPVIKRMQPLLRKQIAEMEE